ncbi:hypothetical protein [Aliiglaciecola aliphaticivorans]
MRHNKVPHTILRNGIYYLNIRNGNSWLKISLRTNKPLIAFEIIATLLSFSKSAKQLTVMDKDKVRLLIDSTRQKIINATNAVLDREGEFGDECLDQYMRYYHRIMQAVEGSSSAPSNFSEEVPQPDSFREFKLKRIFNSDIEIKDQASSLLNRLIKIDDSGYREKPYLEKDYVVVQDILEEILVVAKHIKSSLVKGNVGAAKESIKNLPDVDTSPDYYECKDRFLEAGKLGKLSNTSKGKREL